ncbi:MAG: hypothetical protein SFV32_07175 [Opitutaceae bacterium]|nr:hypothetical protein [Opitutaceae bacterium]
MSAQLMPLNDPPVRCYAHHACTTSILGEKKRMKAVADSYINLEFRGSDAYSSEERFLDFHPYVDIATIANAAGCVVRDYNAAEVESAGPYPHRLVDEAIRKGFRVAAYLDSYHLPSTDFHNKSHHSDLYLIEGASDRSVNCVGYANKNDYKRFVVGHSSLDAAIRSQIKVGQAHQNEKVIRTIRVGENHPPIAGPNSIISSLSGFLRGESHFYSSTRADSVFGIMCYEELRRIFNEAGEDGFKCDIRKSRLLLERIVQLTKYFSGNLDDRIYAEWKSVETILRGFHLKIYQHNTFISFGKTRKTVGLADHLRRVIESERKVAERTIEALTSVNISARNAHGRKT